MATIKKPEIVIFLDMDGVIADFDGHAVSQGKKKPDGSVHYEALDYNWWSTIPAFPGARNFYYRLQDMAVVKFLTAPVLDAARQPGASVDPGCFKGKLDWLAKFLPARGRFITLDFISSSGADKYLLAGPKRILIDDRPENIEAWTKAGGIGILHTGDYAATLMAVRAAVDKIKGPQVSSAPSPQP